MQSSHSAPIAPDRLVRAYLTAKRHVVDSGYDHEIAWQLNLTGGLVTTASFVEEAAWVVLSAGMRESVVRSVFPRIAAACGDFELQWTAQNRAAARQACLDTYGHEGKIDAILDIAARAAALGDEGLRAALADPEPFLRSLPYIGPVTWRHLAKNLGAPVAKADRHLVRLAAATGRPSVDVMCEEIRQWLGEPIAVVDIVLWRWSVLHSQSCCEPCDGLPHRQPTVDKELCPTTAAAVGA